MKQKLKKAALIGAGILGGYVLLAAAVALVFPLQIPAEDQWARSGDFIASKYEKMEQTFFEPRGDKLGAELTILEDAAGPPLHYHQGFDEDFEVLSGSMSLELGGEVLTFVAGQKGKIPAGVMHRPFTGPGQRAVLRGELPPLFATCLAQLYGTIDALGGPGPGMMLHLAMTHPYCDTHVAPVPVEKVLFFLLGPVARVAGYKSYYPERAPKRAANPDTVAATRE